MLKINYSFLTNRREQLGYTLEDMKQKLGFKAKSTFARYEKGERRIPGDMLPLLAKALNCHILDFYTEEKIDNLETKRFTAKNFVL